MTIKRKTRYFAAISLCFFLFTTFSTVTASAMDINDEPISPYAPITTAAMQYLSYCDLSFQVEVAQTDHLAIGYDVSTLNCSLSDLYTAASTTVNVTASIQNLATARTNGLLNYLASCDIQLLSWDTFIEEPSNVVITDDGSATCNVYVWTNYEWYNSDFPTPMESGFGTNHTLTLVPDTQGNYQIVSDAYNEWDISGINTEATSNTEIMSLTASFSTSSMHPFATTTTGPSQVFNRSKAAEYANLYVGSYTSGTARYSDYYNRMYRNFNSADGLTGGDCVNYVSQCLYYAGLKKTSTWTYNNNGTVCTNTSHKANQNGYPSTHTCTADDTASTAWTVVSPFINAIQAAYASSYNTSPSTSSFHVGDIGFLSSGGTPYHAFICVGVSGSTFLINAHNNDRKQVSYNSSSITNLAIHCLHIHNPSSSWLKYNSTSHRAVCDSGCGYSFYGTHYAQTPGTNVACLGCGYVGNINQGST